MDKENITAIWNEVCSHVKQQKRNRSPESDFQNLFETVFAELGWSRLKGEIVSQLVIPTGAASSMRPDIVIRGDGVDQFAVELKRPSVTAATRHTDQLISYMLQLKLPFGLYFGENIQIYYDDPLDNKKPIKVGYVEFTKDNEAGIILFQLLKKNNFSHEAACQHCRYLLNETLLKKQATKIAEEIIEGRSEIDIDAILVEAISQNYGEEVAPFVKEDISISLSNSKISKLNPTVCFDSNIKKEADQSKSMRTGAVLPKKELYINNRPVSTKEFEAALVRVKRAERTLFYVDGKSKTDIWHSRNFRSTSNLHGNLASGPLRNYQTKGITGIRLDITEKQ